MERDLGEQPIAVLLKQHDLQPGDLVEASTMMLNYKMVSRACKGRRLTPNVQSKVLQALNAAQDVQYVLGDLFTY